ncbi:phage tail assembly chaperone [Rhizobium sp. No.120]
MAEFPIKGFKYRSGTMDAMTQFHVVRRLGPVLGSLRGMLDNKLEDGLALIADAISKMSDADTEYVINACMAVVQREQAGGTGWAPIWSTQAKRPMFDDIDMAVMIQIVIAVIGAAIVPFSAALPSSFKA